MDVGGEVANGGFDMWREGAAVGKVAAQTHARRSDPASAAGHVEEGADGQVGVLVVGGDLLGDFVLVASVGAGHVVGERRWAGEFMVA